jgi:hypothetical protein
MEQNACVGRAVIIYDMVAYDGGKGSCQWPITAGASKFSSMSLSRMAFCSVAFSSFCTVLFFSDLMIIACHIHNDNINPINMQHCNLKIAHVNRPLRRKALTSLFLQIAHAIFTMITEISSTCNTATLKLHM